MVDRQLGNGPQRRASGFGHRFEALEIGAGERANGDYQRSVSIGKLSPGRVLRHRIISRMFAAPESDVRRRVRCGRPRYDGRDVFIEYGNERSDVRQAKQDAVVFYGVVRWSHHAVTISSTVSHELYRKIVKRDIVSNLLERPRVTERRNAIGPHLEPFACDRSGDRDHVLFGNPGIDEPIAHGALQWLERHETEIAGKKHHIACGASRHKRIAKLLSHCASSSSIAAWYCCSFNGR